MSKLLELVKPQYPKQVEDRFVVPLFPPLTRTELLINLLLGSERGSVKAPTTGDASLVVSYKGYEAAILSFLTQNADLHILQLQVTHSKKAYRVHTGVRLPQLFAAETERIARAVPDILRITLPHLDDLPGFSEIGAGQIEAVIQRLGKLIQLLQMIWSAEEQQYVKDIKK
jgi:hypothetical protein